MNFVLNRAVLHALSRLRELAGCSWLRDRKLWRNYRMSEPHPEPLVRMCGVWASSGLGAFAGGGWLAALKSGMQER
jgi:hypothetical protein